jgi:LSD1 subclass zinc finger protein
MSDFNNAELRVYVKTLIDVFDQYNADKAPEKLLPVAIVVNALEAILSDIERDEIAAKAKIECFLCKGCNTELMYCDGVEYLWCNTCQDDALLEA